MAHGSIADGRPNSEIDKFEVAARELMNDDSERLRMSQHRGRPRPRATALKKPVPISPSETFGQHKVRPGVGSGQAALNVSLWVFADARAC